MARQSASDVGAHRCAELTSAVNLYTATDLRTVQGVLVPFLVLNGRRDGMRIFCRFGISNESALSQALADCTNWTSTSIDYNHNFDFSIPNSQSHWQLYLVLIFSGASAHLRPKKLRRCSPASASRKLRTCSIPTTRSNAPSASKTGPFLRRILLGWSARTHTTKSASRNGCK